MTPAIAKAQQARVAFQIHEYRHDPAVASYGQEAAEALGVSPERIFKTLLVQVEGKGPAVAVVPVAGSLDLKAFAAALGAKRAEMMEPRQAQRLTGYLVGAISPVGQKKALPTILDESALALASIYVSAGRRGLELELAPTALMALCGAKAAAIARASHG